MAKAKLDKAIFSAGCFWGVEEAFRKIKGVKSTTVGYAGGWTKDPTYEKVSSGKTGHAESVLVEFDPKKISFKELLEIFWKIHDPTTLDRQGLDFGSQYRSAIFFHDKKQLKQALDSKKALEESGKFGKKIVTEINPAGPFFPAEEYHQKYFLKTGRKTC